MANAERVMRRRRAFLRRFRQEVRDTPISEWFDFWHGLLNDPDPEIAVILALAAVDDAKRHGLTKAAEMAKELIAEEMRGIASSRHSLDEIANAKIRRRGRVFKLIANGEELGRIIERGRWLTIELPNISAELPLSVVFKNGVELGRAIFDLGRDKEKVLALALAMEKYLTTKFGEMADEIIKDMWYGIADDMYV